MALSASRHFSFLLRVGWWCGGWVIYFHVLWHYVTSGHWRPGQCPDIVTSSRHSYLCFPTVHGDLLMSSSCPPLFSKWLQDFWTSNWHLMKVLQGTTFTPSGKDEHVCDRTWVISNIVLSYFILHDEFGCNSLKNVSQTIKWANVVNHDCERSNRDSCLKLKSTVCLLKL